MSSAAPGHKIRVAFHAEFRFHVPILAPIEAVVARGADTLLTLDRRKAVAFGPDVVVLASATHLEYFRRHTPRAFLVNVRHGMIGKAGLKRRAARPSARVFDAVSVGDPMRAAHYERMGARPLEFWATGYPQIDPLFRRDPPPPLPLPAGRPTVLYAPTWNLGLTSATMLGDRLVDLIRARAPAVNVLIKPHPVIGDWRPRWMSTWRRLAATRDRVFLVEDTHADVVPYLLAADVLVSDASSVIFEYLALDRPIVLVTNPRHTADPAWEPEDVVWRWRDVGAEIHDPQELPAAIADALAFPERRAERRRARAAELFGPFTDGQSHARIAERILVAGARVRAGEHRPAAAPPSRRVLFGANVKAALRGNTAIRRLALGPLERLRLALRDRRSRTAEATVALGG